MAHNHSFYDDDDVFDKMETPLPRPVRFWLFLLCDIPSIYCSFIVLFYLFMNKTLRSQLINHILIILLIIGLIIELINIPFYLIFLHLGVVQPSTPLLCLIWWFMDIGLYNGCTIIMAWASIHRYLFIFHDKIFMNQKKRFIFHYIPLIILILYIFIFYIAVIVFPPCMNTYDYLLPVCNDFPCYLNDQVLGIWDSVMNSIIPTMIIIISSVSVLIRVSCQKRRLHQPHLWRKQRKMTIQLLLHCIPYLITNIPLNILIFAHLCGLPEDIGVEAQLYFDYLCYFVVFFFPFTCLGSLSEVQKNIKWQGLFLFKQPRQIIVVAPQ